MLTDGASAARSVSRPTAIRFRAMIFGSSAAEVLKHGLAPGLEPPDPVEADPVTIPEAQREQRGIRRLPATRHEALDVLEADAILTDALGSDGLVRRMGMHCGVAVPHIHWPEPLESPASVGAGPDTGGISTVLPAASAASDDRPLAAASSSTLSASCAAGPRPPACDRKGRPTRAEQVSSCGRRQERGRRYRSSTQGAPTSRQLGSTDAEGRGRIPTPSWSS